MTDKLPPLPEPDFRLKWRDGSYYVSKPNIETADCYTDATVRSLIAAAMAQALEDAARVCDGIAETDGTGYGLVEDCAAAIRAMKGTP